MKNQAWNTNLYKTAGSFVTDYGHDLITLLNPQEKETILDLGCGTGRLTNEISKFSKDVYGSDFSKNMISAAKEAYPNIDFKIDDAQKNLNYPKNFFDAVFSNAALHWMLDAEQVIKNVNKILKKHGRFVFEMGGKGNINKLLKAIDKISRRFSLKDPKLQNYYPSISEYTSILEKNGFEVKFANLFERPTILDGADGLKNWIKIFRGSILEQLGDKKSIFLEEVEKIARPQLYKNGNWYADYVRLRIVAYKI